MLQVIVPKQRLFNDATNEIIYTNETKLQLEHSLVSLAKWESKWNKSFLETIQSKKITKNEFLDYIKCMTLTQNVDPNVYYAMPKEVYKQIEDYMNMPMTGFHPKKKDSKMVKEILTAENFYCWMITLNIPFECQKWHLNRLMALIQAASIYNKEPDKMSAQERMALNKARRAKSKSRG